MPKPKVPAEVIREDAATLHQAGHYCGACGFESYELIWDITGADPTRYCPACWHKRPR